VSTLATSRVLVTGAAGFLGAHLCARLTALGAEVHGVSRSERRGSDGMRWWLSPFDDGHEVTRVLSAIRPAVIYHFSGHVTASPELGHVAPSFESLLASTVHTLVWATEHGARVVLAASATEPVAGVPGSPYAAAKACANVYARMFHQLYRTPVVVTRPFWVYGPGQRDTKVVPYVITSLLRGQSPRLSGGTLEADWVYVDDVIEGFLGAGVADAALGEEIDLGTGTLVSVRGVVEQIVEIMRPSARPEFGALPDRPSEVVRAADVERARMLLGWRATISLAAGLGRTVAWHRQQLPGAARGAGG
jgi:nucleoside-diphosphate-sugar epimerase